MSWESCIYEGSVRHRRYRPLAHHFRNDLYLMYLDLSELPALFEGHRLWSARGPAPAWFRRADHLGDPATPLADAVRDLVAERCGYRPQGPVRLLTHLRYFGFVFNPVSFYYCFDEDSALTAVVAEVGNTPWGERHIYVLDARDRPPARALRFRFPKAFHVSPFIDMDVTYDWTFSQPADRLLAHTRNLEAGRVSFDATLLLKRREIDAGALRRVLTRHPFMTAEVFAGIYWQAFRLWRKRAPFFPHPRHRPTTTEDLAP